MSRTARVVAFSTSPEMASDIDRAADEHGVSRSALLRAAVDSYLDRARDGASLARETTGSYADPQTAVPPLAGLYVVLAKRDRVRELCRKHGVHRLWVFGSAVRHDWTPGKSDIDMQAEFEPGFDLGPWAGALYELGNELEQLLGERVDIGVATPSPNPYLRAVIEGERVLVYESA